MKRIIRLIILTLLLVGCEAESRHPESPNYEKHRPQFHFSPPQQWMNDPNGMVFYEGEYHLFYQHYPDSNVWGPMHWGHAVSKDMITWEHLPIALYPDENGYIFSGSAVVDWENTSGFGSETNPPMVAMYTYHDMNAEKTGKINYQTQGIAYSLDKGRTWTKFKDNPVIENPGIKDYRDPKVIWHQQTKRWVMVLAANDRIQFFSSPDLKSWKYESDFGPGHGSPGRPWECPDLFPMEVDGTGETRWVLIVSVGKLGPNGGSATSYFVGDFDGVSFTNAHTASDIKWLDYGTDNYAFVTWSDIPDNDGRRIGLGWMSNWQYAQIVPTTKWRSAMTLPRVLTLRRSQNGYYLQQQIVQEFDAITDNVGTLENIRATSVNLKEKFGPLYPLMDVRIELEKIQELNVLIRNSLNDVVKLVITKNQLTLDRSKSGLVDFHQVFGGVHTAPINSNTEAMKIRILVDLSSIEVLINDGETVLTEIMFPNEPFDELMIYNDSGLEINRIDLQRVQSTRM